MDSRERSQKTECPPSAAAKLRTFLCLVPFVLMERSRSQKIESASSTAKSRRRLLLLLSLDIVPFVLMDARDRSHNWRSSFCASTPALVAPRVLAPLTPLAVHKAKAAKVRFAMTHFMIGVWWWGAGAGAGAQNGAAGSNWFEFEMIIVIWSVNS
jgi:hypothetical protein